MKRRTAGIVLAVMLLAGCTVSEQQPEATIPTDPVTYEDTGVQVIHAGYYEMTQQIYINRGDSAKEVRGLIPDLEITLSYDYSGRRTAQTRLVREGESQIFLYNEQYEYDEDGSIIRVIIRDEEGNQTGTAEKKEDGWHEYDQSGAEVTAEARDSWGNRMRETSEDGTTIMTEYNRNGNPVKQEILAEDGTLLKSSEYIYSANDCLPDEITVKDGNGTIIAEYYLSRGTLYDGKTYSRYFQSGQTDTVVSRIRRKLYEETGLTGEIIAETEENRAVAVYSYE